MIRTWELPTPEGERTILLTETVPDPPTWREPGLDWLDLIDLEHVHSHAARRRNPSSPHADRVIAEHKQFRTDYRYRRWYSWGLDPDAPRTTTADVYAESSRLLGAGAFAGTLWRRAVARLRAVGVDLPPTEREYADSGEFVREFTVPAR